VRVFLDANVLFSAARADGAIRTLLRLLQSDGHILVADGYVIAEASRNLSVKVSAQAAADLQTLLGVVEVAPVRLHSETNAADWLPPKDRPVLLAAMALQCDALVTGDRTHFGAGYGKSCGGVIVYSPALLAKALLDL
jgi:uncharacterized protein